MPYHTYDITFKSGLPRGKRDGERNHMKWTNLECAALKIVKSTISFLTPDEDVEDHTCDDVTKDVPCNHSGKDTDYRTFGLDHPFPKCVIEGLNGPNWLAVVTRHTRIPHPPVVPEPAEPGFETEGP